MDNTSGELFLNKIFRNLIIKKNIFNQLRLINNNKHQVSYTIKELIEYKNQLIKENKPSYLRNLYLNITNDDYIIGGDKHSLSILKDLTSIETLEFSKSFSTQIEQPLNEILPIDSLTELKFNKDYIHSFSRINSEFNNKFNSLVNLKKLVLKIQDNNYLDYKYDQDFFDHGFKKFNEDDLKEREYIDQLPPNLTFLKLYGDFNSISNQLLFSHSLVKLKLTFDYSSTSKEINGLQDIFNQISNLSNLKSLQLTPHYNHFKYIDTKLESLPINLKKLNIQTLEILKSFDVLKNSNLIKLKIGKDDKSTQNEEISNSSSSSNRLCKIEFHSIPSNYSIYPQSLKQVIIYDTKDNEFTNFHGNSEYCIFPSLTNLFNSIRSNLLLGNEERPYDDFNHLIKSIHFYKIDNNTSTSTFIKNIDFIKDFKKLESLSFEKEIKFNFEINDFILPTTLKSISFNNHFNPLFEFDNLKLPTSIEYLEFGTFFNSKSFATLLNDNKLPNLKVFKFNENSVFNQQIDLLPSKTIEVLLFGNNYNPVSLPSNFKECCLNLTRFRIGNNFNLSLLKNNNYKFPKLKSFQVNIKELNSNCSLNSLPITKIKFSKYFNSKLKLNLLPTLNNSLKSIEFLDDYSYKFNSNSLPSSIEHIIFNRSYLNDFNDDHDDDDDDDDEDEDDESRSSLPSSLISITINQNINNQYPDFKIMNLPNSFKNIITTNNNKKFINKINLNENLSKFLYIK